MTEPKPPVDYLLREALDAAERLRKQLPWYHRIRLLPHALLTRRAIRKLQRQK